MADHPTPATREDGKPHVLPATQDGGDGSKAAPGQLQAPMQPLPLTKPLYELRHPGEFILTEQPGHLSRDNIIVASGSGVIIPGTVLTAGGGKYTPTVAAGVGDAIAIYGCDATSADQKISAITRMAEVNGNTLVYDPNGGSINSAALRAPVIASLLTHQIVVRGDIATTPQTYPDR